MKLPGKRVLFGAVIAAAALGAGGVAYAASTGPGPDQTYVTVEEDAPRSADGRDCPEKNGAGQGQPEQGQSEQGQSEQGQARPDESVQGLA